MGYTKVKANGFGMADVQMPIRLRWKACVHTIVKFSCCIIFIDNTLNKMAVLFYIHDLRGNISNALFNLRMLTSLPSNAIKANNDGPLGKPLNASRVGCINFPADISFSSAVFHKDASTSSVSHCSTASKQFL